MYTIFPKSSGNLAQKYCTVCYIAGGQWAATIFLNDFFLISGSANSREKHSKNPKVSRNYAVLYWVWSGLCVWCTNPRYQRNRVSINIYILLCRKRRQERRQLEIYAWFKRPITYASSSTSPLTISVWHPVHLASAHNLRCAPIIQIITRQYAAFAERKQHNARPEPVRKYNVQLSHDLDGKLPPLARIHIKIPLAN